MRNVESSIDWMSFSNKMKQVACQLSSSACPMVLVLPDGREIRFADINVDTFDYKGKCGDTEYTSIGFKVNLLGAEVIDGKDSGSLANLPSANGAKMHEVLSKFCAYSAVVLNTGMFNRVHLEALLNMAKAALASPRRNCDVGTVEERAKRYHKFCRGRMCETCPAFIAEKDDLEDGSCIIRWEDMPYEEGGEG